MTLEYTNKLFEKDYVEPYDVLLYNNDVFNIPLWGKYIGRQNVEAILALHFHL